MPPWLSWSWWITGESGRGGWEEGRQCLHDCHNNSWWITGGVCGREGVEVRRGEEVQRGMEAMQPLPSWTGDWGVVVNV